MRSVARRLLPFAAAAPCWAQWTTVRLHPDWAEESVIYGLSGHTQVGQVAVAGIHGPALWHGSAGSAQLLGSGPGVASAASGSHQGGSYIVRATLWQGSAGSALSLHPSGADVSEILAMAGNMQAGTAAFNGVTHAGYWQGTAASFVDLHPPGARNSRATATDGVRVGGFYDLPAPTFGTHAVIWDGSAAAMTDLHPIGAAGSYLRGMGGNQQVGEVIYPNTGGVTHAALWSGEPGSFIDLQPYPTGASTAYATNGAYQVGFATSAAGHHAALWAGTPQSHLDLHQFLPPGYSRSTAYAITEHNGLLMVGGAATNLSGQREAFLWINVPAPPAALPLAAGLLGAIRRRRPAAS